MATENIIADYLLAAEQGNIAKLTACTASGVDINASNRQGRTAITLASLNKHYACVSVLVPLARILISRIKPVLTRF